MSESEAVSLAQTGDPSAFTFLYQNHRQFVFANCLKILRNNEEAEDLTQEVFMLVLEKIPQFEGRCAFTTWLHRLTTNRVLDHLNARKRKPMSTLCDVPAPEERYILPDQHAQLEILEAIEGLSTLQKFMVEGEMSGKYVNGKQPSNHIRLAQKKLREHFA